MIGEFSDSVLALAIVNEKINHRDSIQLDSLRVSLKGLQENLNRVWSAVKQKLQEPNLIPVYCFEYAPDC